jgi:ElaB/YqjD/DUF883 family membrane-anchored ribosome-binding protein
MATSEQLEHEADATRGRIEDTLAELRRRLSPGLLMDDVLGFAKESGGGEFVRNLGREISANPLPVALMGAGLAWLMAAQARRPASGAGASRPGFKEWIERTEAMSDFDTNRNPTGRSPSGQSDEAGKSDSYYGKASEMADSARERASDMYDRARETTSDVYGKARETTAGAYGRAREAAGSMTRSMSSSTRGIANFMQEQPIVLAGIGVALGAIIGAMLPTTETEERYMGPTAQSLKDDAKDMAREQWERGKSLAEEGWDEAKDAARRTWEDAKDEADKAWRETKEKTAQSDSMGQTKDLTGTRAPLVPSGQEESADRLADAAARNTRSDV